MNNSPMNHLTGREIAIISMAGRFPGAKSVEEFWSNLRAGVESISTFTDEELLAAGLSQAELRDPNYVRAKGVLDDIEMFDGSFFGFNPREAEIIDPQHRLFLECAWEAMERAGYDTERYDGRIGVYGGAGVSSYLFTNLATNPEVIERIGMYQTLMVNTSDNLTTYVSYKLNLKGPSVNIQTACSTSLVAIHVGCQSLLSGECDMALAGGITITLPQKWGYQYREGGINSPDGHCRPFDAQAKGTLGGNGVGVVLLKRLDEALADGDIIHAVIKGSAINNDGSLKVGYTAPSVQGQAKAIVAAQLTAEISADSISYVEAHGTATVLGDPIEVAALTKAFRASTSHSHFCALGSVKSNFGHLDAAAGVAGLIKTVLALKHRELPPSLHYTAPNPVIDFDSSPFYVNRELTAWETNGAGPRRAGVSSFGIGGTNAHVVVEEAPQLAAPAPSARGWHLLVLSGRTAAAVTAATEKLRRHLEEHPDISLADVAYTLQIGRREFAQRRAVVCRDVADAIDALSQPTRWIDGLVGLTAGNNGDGGGSARGAVLMYSGQGAQYAGMGRELYEHEAVFREAVDQCAAAFEAAQGYDLREVLYPEAGHEAEAEARLLETEVTQPALFVLEYALTRVWQEWGLRIEALMGHSIGEYVAACMAGVMSVEDGVRLVGRRGRLMQGMARGAMLAVRLSEVEIQPWLRDEQLSVAAVNGPQQCVLSGSESAIAEAEARLTAAGVGVKRLATSHAFHSSLMREAAQVLASEINGVMRGNITIPYISNVSGSWAQVDEVRNGEYWGQQMLERVQWWRGVEAVLESGAKVLLEVGPGESLTSVVKEGVRGRNVAVLSTLRGRRAGVDGPERGMVASLGEMWVRGVGVTWGGMYAGEERRRVELPTYEFERERYWVEARPGAATRITEEDREGEAERKQTDIGRWLYVPVWKQSVGWSKRGTEEESESGRKWLVLREESGLSDELVARLETAGGEVVSVSVGEEFRRVDDTTFVVHPGRKKEFERLVHELTKSGWRPQCIVHLWSVGEELPEIAVDGHNGVHDQIEQFDAAQEQGFYSLIYLAHVWGTQPSSEPIFINAITCNTQRVTGVERLRPEQATVLGACRVIGQEYPHMVCRSVDVQLPARSALVKQLARELENKGESFAVAYRGYERWVQTYERVHLEARDKTQLPVRLRDGGVYLITGGLGKVGLTLATQLVRSAQAKLILTGRTAFPARAHWQQWLDTHGEQDRISLTIRKLDLLEAEGAEILVVQADVSDFARMQAAIDEAEERFGPLNGVIHAAGNVGEQAFRAISETGSEEASQQFVPKAHGLIVLETLLAERELDFCMLVSSLSSVLGGLGFAAYAAANTYMDTFVQKHNERDENGWLSVNWDGWRFEETPHPDESKAEDAPLGVTAEEGSEVFMRLLDLERASQIIVSTGDLAARLKKWIRLEPSQTTTARSTEEARMTLYPRPSLPVAYIAPRNALEQQVVEIWEELLGVAPVGVEDNFFELGGHSLLATQVVSRMRESLRLEIPLRDLFERATVAELAASIETAQSEGHGLEAPPIVKVSRAGKLPLSFAQQRLWFLDQLEPGSTLYNLPSAIQLSGVLHVDALERALNEIVRRHEVLRTTILQVDREPQQSIWPAAPFPLPVTDLSALSREEREVETSRFVREEAQRPFDLENGPLLRVSVLRVGEAEHVALVTMHHIVSDGWSMDIFINEVAALYNAFITGQQSPLEELPIQYADFAHWQRRWLQGEVLATQVAYWREELADAPTVIDLPIDKPRPPVQTYNGAHHSLQLSAELSTQLREVSRRHNSTLFMTLLAAFDLLLCRYAGQEQVLIGTPIANRNRSETEGLIGFFVNTLVLRGDVRGNPSFGELLRRVRETALGAYAHQDLPFEKLVEELQPERDLSRSPLFQVMFVLQNAADEVLELEGLSLSEVESAGETAKFELTLTLQEQAEVIVGGVSYNRDLYEAETIGRVAASYERVLQAVVADAEQRVFEIDLLSEVERRQIIEEWNETAAAYPRELTLPQLFEAQAARTPEAVALLFEDTALTYRELNERANQLARYLQRTGVGPEVLVGILMDRSVEMVVGLLGILKAGGAYVPLDPAYPEERLRYMVQDGGVRLVLTRGGTWREKAGVSGEVARVLRVDEEWEEVARESAASVSSGVGATHLAYVIYTSGSTGKPKGAMNTHGGICNRLHWMQAAYQLEADDCVLQKTPFSFDVSVWEFFWPLLTGSRLVLARPGGHMDNAYLIELIKAQQITTLHFVPSLLQAFLEEVEVESCGSLRRVICSGEALSVGLQRRFFERFENCELHNLYGPTEAAVDVTYWKCRSEDESRSVPIGKPVANLKTYVLDGRGRPVPVGVMGELHLGGVGLGRGYLGRPELTAERFIPNAFSAEAGARLYRTGDLARYLADGNLEFLGRLDQQVKVRGLRIELGEIESVLSGHPEITESVVLVHQDKQGEKRLVAYIVCENQPASNELREYLRARLPEYMVPQAFVSLPALPLTSNGKIDRRALQALAVEFEAGAGGQSVMARTQVEEIVTAIWAEVLGRETVSVYDNFFELGGHSLLATQVISRVRDAFGQEVALRSLFEQPTVAGLAREIEAGRGLGAELQAPPLQQVERAEKLPLSFAQQRLWFLDQLEPGSTFYNVPTAVRLRGVLNIEALERTLSEVMRRHEVLRTRFIAFDGEPVQVIEAAAPMRLQVLDLSAMKEEAREAEMLRLARAEAGMPFDLSRGPLLRVSLIRLSAEEHVALVTMHHIVSDGWSMGIFINEVAALYNAFITGQESPLEELPIQYADFAHWQRTWLQGEVLAAQLAYWREELADAPTVIDLPMDKPRPPVQTYNGAHHSLQLSAELSTQLRELSRRHSSTLFMTLLAAFDLLLCRYAGQEQVLVGTPIANRNRSETEGLIGFFVNTLVLRGDVRGNPSFGELLRRVREVALGAHAHQDLPFEKLVEELQPERDMSRSPLFQVMFVLQNAPSEALELEGLSLSTVESARETAKFELMLALHERGGVIAGEVEYNLDLFEAETIGRLMASYEQVLQAVVADAEQRVLEIELLSEAERRQIIEGWNETVAAYPRELSLSDLFEEQVDRMPAATALVYGAQQFSYGELNERANRLAHYLLQLGVQAEARVGILLERTPALIVSLLGVLKAGGCYVPLDPQYPQERLKFMRTDAGLRVLLTTRALATASRVEENEELRLVYVEEVEQAASSENPDVAVSAEQLAYLIYTSGSTGVPKGIAITHGSAATLIHWASASFERAALSGVLFSTSICFDLSIFELFVTLSNGGQVIVAENALQLPALAAASQVTLINTVPSAMAELVRTGAVPASVRVVNLAGEALRAELVAEIYAQTEVQAVYNLYGPSEDTTYSTYTSVRAGERVSIGRPIANTRAYVLDKQQRIVPVGVSGELHLGGAGLARGYWQRPELTAANFIPDHLSGEAGGRLYRTGDRVRYLASGELEFLERMDHQVKLRGYRIELGEIEAVLSAHESLREAIVVARETASGDQQLVAYVVRDSDRRIGVGEAAAGESRSDQIAQWETVWDETYGQTAGQADYTFNIIGWNSSYTGLPIPAAEMHSWVDETVNRILGLSPQKVLEIGCGTGLLLFRIAPHTSHYHGTDLSQRALSYIEQHLGDQRPGSIILSRRPADDFAGLEPGAFDTVILNSVAQYFPGVDYLLAVLTAAVKIVKQGSVFLGDIRNLRLLEAFHASVVLANAPPTMTAAECRGLVQERIYREEELFVDPDFFYALKQQLPEISSVEIQLKRGAYQNELTRFRYDVVLHIGRQVSEHSNVQQLDWQADELSVASLQRLLKETAPASLRVTRVPNLRVERELQAAKLLADSDPALTVAEIREGLAAASAVDPEDIWALGELPHQVAITWSERETVGGFDVVFTRDGATEIETSSGSTVSGKSLREFANDPLQGQFARKLVPTLRAYLKENLPDYMVPATFVLLDKLPLTPNSKIDRRALQAMKIELDRRGESLIEPRDAVELQLAHIWEELLDLRDVGVRDDFFRLGGHSLLAVRLMARIQASFGQNLPLTSLFQAATIEKQARLLREQQPDHSASVLVPIQSKGEGLPFFCVHPVGGNVLCYQALSNHLGIEQPFYGIHSLGLLENQVPHTRIEDMAAYYVEDIRRVQPDGPYLLGGWSLGAVIAFEMARQLEAKGQRVSLIALISPKLRKPEQTAARRDEVKLVTDFADLLEVPLDQLNISTDELYKLDSEELLAYVLQRAIEAEMVPQDVQLAQVRRPFEVFKGNMEAKDSYRPQPLSQRLTIFKDDAQETVETPDETIWGALTSGEVEIHTVPGSVHHTIVLEPYVRSLAEQLADCIRRAKKE